MTKKFPPLKNSYALSPLSSTISFFFAQDRSSCNSSHSPYRYISPVSKPSRGIMVITEFCPLKKRVTLNEQAPLRDLNVSKQKEKRELMLMLWNYYYKYCFIFSHMPFHLTGTRSQIPQTTDLKCCEEQLQPCITFIQHPNMDSDNKRCPKELF